MIKIPPKPPIVSEQSLDKCGYLIYVVYLKFMYCHFIIILKYDIKYLYPSAACTVYISFGDFLLLWLVRGWVCA